jgi:sugar phosphate isomerase/epimerase
MQALLFGTQGLNVFGSPNAQQAMLQHLDAVCRIGGILGATRLVFGSPKNRDRTGLSDKQARDISVAFFQRLGAVAEGYGVSVCVEPNPMRYGANFMTTSADTAAIVSAVGHPAVRMQFDTGAIAINGEDGAEVLARFGQLIGHIHASEPDLVTLGEGGTDHKLLGLVLKKMRPAQLVTIEMLATKTEPHVAAVERALRVAMQYYGETECGEVEA